jgi:hypothetical protein
MGEVQLLRQVEVLLMKIHIITGWDIPENELMATELSNQLYDKLIEDYSSLNFDEIEYAMRTIGAGVKDFGKNINLSLIDSVLTPFIHKRAAVRELESRAIKQAHMIEAPKEPIDKELLIKTVRGVYLKLRHTTLIPVMVYDFLVEQKEIDLTLEQKNQVKETVERRLQGEANKEGLAAIRELRELKANAPAYAEKIRLECKRQAVANYFEIQHQIDNF